MTSLAHYRGLRVERGTSFEMEQRGGRDRDIPVFSAVSFLSWMMRPGVVVVRHELQSGSYFS